MTAPAIFRHVPALAVRVPWQPLGRWPTPVSQVTVAGRPLWLKHEGAAHPVYGGNKVRTLEAWLGHARAAGAERLWAIGAYGSNHALATALHAPTAGLAAGAIVFPQPHSAWAHLNLAALIATGCPLVRLRSVLEVPVAAAWLGRTAGAMIMPPGGATPIGTFGAVSAAFELAEQVAAGALPPPGRIVLAAGSTCTTSGLCAGLQLAREVGAWRWPVPRVHAVRVTPWPVTSRAQLVQLAVRTLARVAALGGPAVDVALGRVLAMLSVDGAELGGGYGRPTPRGDAAAERLAELEQEQERPGATQAQLDGVYAAKAAAALLRLHARPDTGPLLLWASKSTAPLAQPTTAQLRAVPQALVRWLRP